METRHTLVDDAARRVQAGTSVVLRGPAGIGKTTIVRAVTERLAADGRVVLRAVASETSHRLPLGAFAGVLSTQPSGAAVERLAAAVGELRRTGARALLVVDDAFLLDDESAALVHHVAATASMPLLVTVRAEAVWPDAIRRLWRDGLAELVDVAPLGRPDAVALVESRLDGVVDAATLDRLVDTGEGNPLVLHELVTASRHAGLLHQRNGVWTADGLVAGATARDLLDARVAAFGAEVRVVAELVAVGGAVPRWLLEACTSKAAVDEARGARVVRERDADGFVEPGHPLVADAVRRSLDADALVACLRRLVDVAMVAADRASGAEMLVPLGLWLLALDDRREADAEALLAAGDRAMDGLRFELAEQLAEAALRAGGGERARDLGVRVRAMQGRASTTDDLTASERRQRAQGMAEAFLLGLAPFDGVRAAIGDAIDCLDPGPLRLELEALDLNIALVVGNPMAPVLERLLAIVRDHPDTQAARVAAIRSANALSDAGRFDEVLRLLDEAEGGQVPLNEFHRYQLGQNRALALHRRGRTAEAERVLAERLSGSDSPLAVTFRSVVRAELDLAAGRPADAARHLGQILTVVGSIDAGGLRTWSRAMLRYANAWANGRDDTDVRPDRTPGLQARPMEVPGGLADCQRLAALDRLPEALRRSLALADRAERDGLDFFALRALHLAGRIQVTASLARRATALAAACQSEWGALMADHLGALASDDAVALEKVAEGFERVGQLALAREAFHTAAAAHRAVGQRNASGRCRDRAAALAASGVVATFAIHQPEATELTPREREVVALAGAGRTNREVAVALGLSARTVETHLQRAYRKLGVNDRSALGRHHDRSPHQAK